MKFKGEKWELFGEIVSGDVAAKILRDPDAVQRFCAAPQSRDQRAEQH